MRFGLDSSAVPATILIAAPEHLSALQQRDDLREVLAFSDADALRALDTITRQRPQVVALERMFASTSRGTAMINRIKADPSLSGCEIRIVSHDSAPARVGPRNGGEGGIAVAEGTPPPVAPLDQRGTRRAPRFKLATGVELQIDGQPATVVDLSVVGAQVVSSTTLKPNQRIRLTVPDGTRLMRFSGAVAWASFEIPKGTARYRAGVEFFDADQAALTRFIEANKK